MDKVSLNFEGYKITKGGVPAKGGIYCVYRGIYDKNANTVDLKQVLYIGESSNANDRLDNHEREKDWKKHLKYEEILIFSFAPIITGRDRAEAAMIYKHKPVENTEYKYSFPFRSVQMSLSGRTTLLSTSFTARDTRTSTYA